MYTVHCAYYYHSLYFHAFYINVVHYRTDAQMRTKIIRQLGVQGMCGLLAIAVVHLYMQPTGHYQNMIQVVCRIQRVCACCSSVEY